VCARVALDAPARGRSSAALGVMRPKTLALSVVAAAIAASLAFAIEPPSGGSTAAPLTGAEAERSIAWSTVRKGDAIPALMPRSRSADALDAGFAPEWVERSVRPLPGGEESAQLMLGIVSEQRAPDDAWADKVEDYLREFIGTQVDVQAPTTSRVFCNSVGCLCYLERTGSPLTWLMISKALKSQAASEFGTEQMGMTTMEHAPRPGTSWELTIVTRRNVTAAPGQAR
jgi:hypothetical protein